ncbi:MAG: potassium transporter Kup [Rhodospirillales bacterium]|nr:potassium transporter Kup [Rhodospirillales bacterium]
MPIKVSRPGRADERLSLLVIGALGVVYGDIGTSPLYTIRLVFSAFGGIQPTEANVLGILSLVFWAIFLIVSIEYMLLILRADNNGEGGIVALTALARRTLTGKRTRALVLTAGLAGTALFFGDCIITPAISVLSAVEGLEVATPAFKPYVVPLSLAILFLLFFVQNWGTASIGILFGPFMALWFVTIGILGLTEIVKTPDVLRAVDPSYGIAFAFDHGWQAFVALGAVFLAVTGAEAAYADMGHFGKRAIRIGWFGIALPGLLLCYFGQGALIIRDASAVRNPFFLLAPDWLLYPLVALATVATVIASQAVISGAFSICNQAVQLGLAPRLEVRHTSERAIGQIYMPQINWALFVAVVVLVLEFQTSSSLGAAYGIAVTGTMAITTALTCATAVRRWNLPRPLTVALFGLFLPIDLMFLGANSLKILEGGWFPILVGCVIYVLMSTWIRGREVLAQRLRADNIDVDDFIRTLRPDSPHRIAGTAVYLARMGETVPHALLHNLKHNKVLHERVVLLTVVNEDIPYVEPAERIEVTPLPKRFYRVIVHQGFTETPNIPAVLELCADKGLEFDMMQTSFFLGRVTLVRASRSRMWRWRRRLFFWLTRNARSATDFFHIPSNRVVELGAQIAL